MAVQKTGEGIFENLSNYLIIDVRSPGEYAHAHIPTAFSLPLFTDEERAAIGTTYKQASREAAIKLGLPFFGTKMQNMIEEVEGWAVNYEKTNGKKPTILVHCWRGGMRSAAVAWLLDLYGFKTEQLTGGYKAYRNWVLGQFEKNYSMKVLGGFTGSGKTEILLQLQKSKLPVIDLEGLANHKGSAFGALGQNQQHTQEQFENNLAAALWNTSAANSYFWIEDESQRIGTNMLPASFFKNLRNSICYFIDIPFNARLQFIVQAYGKFAVADLIAATLRIQKRLGGLETKTAVNFLVENNIEGAFSILLKYYDKVYLKNIESAAIPKFKTEKIVASEVHSIHNAGLFMHL
jgi:tRNA 2-selenouridine synthase